MPENSPPPMVAVKTKLKRKDGMRSYYRLVYLVYFEQKCPLDNRIM
jgi:hypothetical protein